MRQCFQYSLGLLLLLLAVSSARPGRQREGRERDDDLDDVAGRRLRAPEREGRRRGRGEDEHRHHKEGHRHHGERSESEEHEMDEFATYRQQWKLGQNKSGSAFQPMLAESQVFREGRKDQTGSNRKDKGHKRPSHRPIGSRGRWRKNRERGPAGRLTTTDMPMPTPASGMMDMNQIMNYFEKYHYMGNGVPDPEVADLVNSSMGMAIHTAAKMFQKRYSRYGLKETGELDNATMALMMKPRCGNPDIMSMDDMSKRKRRYLLSPAKWEKNDLVYQIVEYPADGDLSYTVVDREIRRAFDVWQEVTPLKFTQMPYSDRSRKADIEIKFVAPYRDHGDNNPFDGPGGTLAHAFFPYPNFVHRGDTHFDEGEVWTLTSGRTDLNHYNLFQVAAHEFGHALGLGHSMDPEALMAPFYPGYIPDFTLPLDDIMGIQALYGGPSPPMETTSTTTTTTAPTQRETTPPLHTTPSTPKPTTTTTTKPVISDKEKICNEASFDAITTILNDHGEYKTYGFRGEYYFLIDARTGGIAAGYPRLIREGWPGLPDHIDAALFWDVGDWMWDANAWKWVREPPVTYVFKGDQFWTVGDMSVVKGPQPISRWGFPGNIDAAFVWGRNQKTYVFKGDEYYRYSRDSGLDRGYPRPISVWGLPNNLDAVLQYTSGQSFFFKGNQFYGYNDNRVQVESGYPRPSYGYFFRC